MNARGHRLAIVGALVSLAQPGCREAPSPEPLRIAHESAVLTFDPNLFPESATASTLGNFYEPLVVFDADNRIVPRLATSWVTADPLTWRFHVRPGVRFHDGTLLGGEDVARSLDRARLHPSSGIKGLLATIQAVEASGLDVTVHTSRPDPLLLSRLTYVFVTSEQAAEQDFPEPVGTGCYRFVSQGPEGRIEAEAFADHWLGPPAIARVSFLAVPAAEAERALREGSVDVLRSVPATAIAAAEASGGFRVEYLEGLGAYFLWPDALRAETGERNPLSDRRVRQALSLALDRQLLIDSLGGLGTPLNQLVHRGLFGYVPDLPPLPHDPLRARQRLAEAGYPEGLKTRLAFRRDGDLAPVAETVRRMLVAVGFEVELEPMSWQAMIDGWQSERVPLRLAGWQFDEGDAWGFMRDCIYTRDATLNYGAYNTGYSDPEMDRLIDEADLIFDRHERLDHYQKMMRRALEEMPLVPLYARTDTYAVASRVRWRPRLDGRLHAAEMSWVR